MLAQAIRLMGLLLAINAEAVLLIFIAWWSAKWLTAQQIYPQINWFTVCFGIAIVLISYSWYAVLKVILKKRANE